MTYPSLLLLIGFLVTAPLALADTQAFESYLRTVLAQRTAACCPGGGCRARGLECRERVAAQAGLAAETALHQFIATVPVPMRRQVEQECAQKKGILFWACIANSKVLTQFRQLRMKALFFEATARGKLSQEATASCRDAVEVYKKTPPVIQDEVDRLIEKKIRLPQCRTLWRVPEGWGAVGADDLRSEEDQFLLSRVIGKDFWALCDRAARERHSQKEVRSAVGTQVPEAVSALWLNYVRAACRSEKQGARDLVLRDWMGALGSGAELSRLESCLKNSGVGFGDLSQSNSGCSALTSEAFADGAETFESVSEAEFAPKELWDLTEEKSAALRAGYSTRTLVLLAYSRSPEWLELPAATRSRVLKNLYGLRKRDASACDAGGCAAAIEKERLVAAQARRYRILRVIDQLCGGEGASTLLGAVRFDPSLAQRRWESDLSCSVLNEAYFPIDPIATQARKGEVELARTLAVEWELGGDARPSSVGWGLAWLASSVVPMDARDLFRPDKAKQLRLLAQVVPVLAPHLGELVVWHSKPPVIREKPQKKVHASVSVPRRAPPPRVSQPLAPLSPPSPSPLLIVEDVEEMDQLLRAWSAREAKHFEFARRAFEKLEKQLSTLEPKEVDSDGFAVFEHDTRARFVAVSQPEARLGRAAFLIDQWFELDIFTAVIPGKRGTAEGVWVVLPPGLKHVQWRESAALPDRLLVLDYLLSHPDRRTLPDSAGTVGKKLRPIALSASAGFLEVPAVPVQEAAKAIATQPGILEKFRKLTWPELKPKLEPWLNQAQLEGLEKRIAQLADRVKLLTQLTQ